MNKYLILIIDDDQNFCLALKLYLEKKYFSTFVVNSVRQALNFLNHNLPNLIILDIVMPKIDGFSLLKSIRSNTKFAYIPIIILTAKAFTSDRIKGYYLGCNAYLSKPFDLEELISIVHNLISQSENYAFKAPTRTTKESILAQNLFFQKLNPQININIIDLDNTNYTIELTPKEQYTLNAVVKGHMNKEIAKRLKISIRNIERYVSRLLKKIGAKTRTELVKKVVQNIFET